MKHLLSVGDNTHLVLWPTTRPNQTSTSLPVRTNLMTALTRSRIGPNEPGDSYYRTFVSTDPVRIEVIWSKSYIARKKSGWSTRRRLHRKATGLENNLCRSSYSCKGSHDWQKASCRTLGGVDLAQKGFEIGFPLRGLEETYLSLSGV